MNVALYGGSFDPPHNGHVAVAEAALEHLDIDRLIVVPAYLNPFKERVAAPGFLRLKWLRKIFHDPRIEVSDFEVMQERPVRTIETVRHYRKPSDHFYVIIGADNLKTLPMWYDFENLNQLVTWVVATRDGIEIDPAYVTLHVNEPVSATALRRLPRSEDLPAEIAIEIIEYYKETHAQTH